MTLTHRLARHLPRGKPSLDEVWARLIHDQGMNMEIPLIAVPMRAGGVMCWHGVFGEDLSEAEWNFVHALMEAAGRRAHEVLSRIEERWRGEVPASDLPPPEPPYEWRPEAVVPLGITLRYKLARSMPGNGHIDDATLWRLVDERMRQEREQEWSDRRFHGSEGAE